LGHRARVTRSNRDAIVDILEEGCGILRGELSLVITLVFCIQSGV
jgi:hypothetical protein